MVSVPTPLLCTCTEFPCSSSLGGFHSGESHGKFAGFCLRGEHFTLPGEAEEDDVMEEGSIGDTEDDDGGGTDDS